MGWLWNTPSPSNEPAPSQASAAPPSTAQSTPEEQSKSLPPKASTRSLTRDELAERELQDFLSELEADTQFSSTKYNRVPQPLPRHQSAKGAAGSQTLAGMAGLSNPDAKAGQDRRSSKALGTRELSLEESLLPTDMSCREAFDAAFYCQSLGGQFTNLYRYGGIRSCSENWSDFWFCMRMKSYHDAERGGMIRDHYKRKGLKYKIGPSSEDIWEGREERLEWGEAFSQTFGDNKMSDEDWNKLERDRRAWERERRQKVADENSARELAK